MKDRYYCNDSKTKIPKKSLGKENINKSSTLWTDSN